MRKLLVIFFLITVSLNSFAQREAENWYFGKNAGIKFTDTGSVSLTNGQLNTYAGNATISDKNGNLLFYTDGVTVYNKTHNVMDNGTKLYGHKFSSQSALIIPYPSNPNLYYIFTTDNYFNNHGVCYSIVDVSYNNGNGKIISKNNQIFTNGVNKMNAIKHSNNEAIWLITHKYQSKNYVAFLINKNGIDMNYIISTGNTKLDFYYDKFGYIKVSPDAKTIVHCIPSHKHLFEICNFNNTTGVINKCLTIDIPNAQGFDRPYSAEFSPSGKYLYITCEGQNFIYQFNLSKKTKLAIENSIKIVGYNFLKYSLPLSLQLGIDGKIYVSNVNTQIQGSYYLGVIEYPEKEDTSCNYIENYLYLNGRKAQAGLPVFIQSYFFIPEFTADNLCFGDTTVFGISDTSHIDSVLWCFGDSISI
ncbi:MAG: hypothetical protein U9R42_11875, partial [Bacteroidota bacterium]|nr:hypothetical protein [Bacteroidota bacterium]